jgi:alpha-tubulin suppressor-like RCC1 family protein
MWGYNPTSSDSNPRSIIPQGCQKVASGLYTSFALIEDGSLLSLGSNTSGQLGIGEVVVGADSLNHVIYPPEFKSRVAFFGTCGEHCFFLSEEEDLYLWGDGCHGRLGIGGEILKKTVPTLLPNWKWALPNTYIWTRWNSIFQWIFLGRLDETSPFNKLHVEIVFNFVSAFYKK